MNARKPNSLALLRGTEYRRMLVRGAALLPWLGGVVAAVPVGRVLTLGPGAEFTDLAAAVSAAQDGDRIDVLPGTYRGHVAVISRRLHLRGLGPGATFSAAGRLAADMGILVVRGDVTVENLGFTGARRAHGNGAGIRFEHGRLDVQRCTFTDNEMGLLGSDHPKAELRVIDSAFGAAPRHHGQLHHLLYASTMARLEVHGCRFEGGWRGHLIKSRARINDIRYNLLRDGPSGQASYELELAEGGHNLVLGNIIVQAPGTQNRSIVAVGYNADPGQGHSLVFAYNTLVNQALWPARFLRIWPQNMRLAQTMIVAHNLFAGRGELGIPEGYRSAGNLQLAIAGLEDVLADKFGPRVPCFGEMPDPLAWPGGWLPRGEFSAPLGTRPRSDWGCSGAVSQGAR